MKKTPPSEASESTSEKYIARPYQRTAIDATVNHTTALIRGSLEREDAPVFSTAGLLEMATGSGKTFTVGRYLEEIITLRDRFNRRYQTKKFQWLNILVLTNRIDGLDQFRDDLVHGKTGERPKSPIIGRSIRENFRIKTFHSKADNLAEVDEAYFTQTEEDEEELLSEQNGRIKDNLFFSTFQTASLKDLAYKLQEIDLIIIDEAHNVKPENDYDLLLQDLMTLGRGGHAPMLLPVTATPTQLTKELFGEAISTFGLAEYIASEYSPDIDYRLVSATTASSKQIQSIKDKVEAAKQCHNPTDKRSLVREIERDFDAIMASYPDMSELVHDLLHARIGTSPETIGQTIIFVNNTREADEIARTINEQCSTEIALSYHSYNDQKKSVSWSREKQSWLHRFAHNDDSVRVIVSVGKLNESVDLPTVQNVVFLRLTDVEKIFLQQFGRWLRGRGVIHYYDYVWGLRNFVWIGEIHDQWRKITEIQDGNTMEWGGGTSSFRLLGESILWTDQSIDLSELGFQIVALMDGVNNFSVATKTQIQFLWKNGTITKENIGSKWPLFAKTWNAWNSTTDYTLPTSLSGLTGTLGGDTKITQADYIISLLEEREFTEQKTATKNQIQSLWKNWIIKKENISQRKWPLFSKSWNSWNPTAGYILPISIMGLISSIGGDFKISTTTKYIISLLEGKEFVERKTVTKTQIQSLWKNGTITKEDLGKKWPLFANAWNVWNPIAGYMLPISNSGLISAIGGDSKISFAIEYITSLLEEREFAEQKTTTKTQIQSLWRDGTITKENLGSKWPLFANAWNAWNPTVGYMLPTSMHGLISTLGGDSKISMTTEYIISLLEGKEFVERKMLTKTQIQSLWKNGMITIENIPRNNWSLFANAWNTWTQTAGYSLPISPEGLIGSLGGDIKVSKTTEYITSLLEGKEFVERKTLTKTQIQSLWRDWTITKENLGSRWSLFAKAWNVQNLTTGCILPTSLGWLIGTLDGDTKIIPTEYIISLLEGTEFPKK